MVIRLEIEIGVENHFCEGLVGLLESGPVFFTHTECVTVGLEAE